MQLFNIAGNDLTKHITMSSYNVNEEDVYTGWTDANRVDHRFVHRQRVSGKFTMKFTEKEEYFSFLELCKSNKTREGYITTKLYVNNLNQVKELDVFITFKPANNLPLYKNGEYKGFEVNVRGR